MTVPDPVVIITGATSAVGRALTAALLQSGARPVLVVRRKDDIDPLRRELLHADRSVFVTSCDVRYEEDVVRLVHRVARQFERIDALINTAHLLGPAHRIEDHPVDAWRNVFATNVTGAFLLCREVLPWMRRQHFGRIVQFAGSAHIGRAPAHAAYYASQLALDGLIRQLSVENQIHGILANLLETGPPQSHERPPADLRVLMDTVLRLIGESCDITGQRVRPNRLARTIHATREPGAPTS